MKMLLTRFRLTKLYNSRKGLRSDRKGKRRTMDCYLIRRESWHSAMRPFTPRLTSPYLQFSCPHSCLKNSACPMSHFEQNIAFTVYFEIHSNSSIITCTTATQGSSHRVITLHGSTVSLSEVV